MKEIVPKGGEDKSKVIEGASEVRPHLGEWYWVKNYTPPGQSLDPATEWLGCVMKVGSNFIELHAPHSSRNGHRTIRVHFDEFWERLRLEPLAEEVIADNIEHYQTEVNRLMEEVRGVSARLGLKPVQTIAGPEAQAVVGTSALAVLSEQVDVRAYENALVVAKQKTLPELFKAIEENNIELARWMLATTMTARAQIEPMKDAIEEIEGKIFNISLYAGLTEKVVKCSDGEPATMNEKLRVCQRRLYMDEECLMNYKAGGMEYGDIEDFDRWIAEPENRDRILPFPRCLVAMRVRRNEKERDSDGKLLQAFINLQIAQSDRLTFLYIRNGEQLYRMSCEMDFGEMLFPDKALYDPSEPMMVKMFGRTVDAMITLSRYEALLVEHEQASESSDKWRRDNPGLSWVHDPYMGLGREIYSDGISFRPDEWKPFDPTNVYFDECMAEIEKQIKEFNRIALIVQGLFDRSQVLHPHPPVRVWDPAGFDRAITLVYDGATTLYAGEQPDFEAYRRRCNASLAKDSVVTGQERFWLSKMAKKENERLDNDWRNRSDYRHKQFRPPGDPGPGRVARISSWRPSSREAVFSWSRRRRGGNGTNLVRCTLSVPEAHLFNISAYKAGDYRQFFADPRTRQQYLKWAPLLLTAEDYLAGKVELA